MPCLVTFMIQRGQLDTAGPRRPRGRGCRAGWRLEEDLELGVAAVAQKTVQASPSNYVGHLGKFGFAVFVIVMNAIFDFIIIIMSQTVRLYS